MKSILPLMVLILSVLMMSSVSHSQNAIPIPDGPYLGQELTGFTPEVFAPGIVSTMGWEVSGVFTPDMKEFYFIREKGEQDNLRQEFVVFKYENNRWHQSVISPRVGQPFISPDGKTMHLGKRYKERTDTGWSEIKSLGVDRYLKPHFSQIAKVS